MWTWDNMCKECIALLGACKDSVMLSMLFLNCLDIPLPSNTQHSGFYPTMFLKLLSRSIPATSSNFYNCKDLLRQENPGRKIKEVECKEHSLQGHITQFPYPGKGPIALVWQVATTVQGYVKFVSQFETQQILDRWGPGHDDNHSGGDAVLPIVLFQIPN